MSKSKQVLGEGLVMKTAEDKDDIEQVAKLDNVVFDEKVGHLCRYLFSNHPNTQPSDLIFVENENINEIVSTICLIPWEWKYDEVILNIGEMGIVGTLEQYRSRGFIRKQADYHRKLLNDRCFDISIIQGIPYFYRQFGYEYAIPLERNCYIEFHQIPERDKNDEPKYMIRQATKDDIPKMEKMYEDSSKSLVIHSLRNSSIWNYLMEDSPNTCTAFEAWLIDDMDNNSIGYFFIPKYHFGNSLVVSEVSKLNYDTSVFILQYLKDIAIERGKPNIRLNLPESCELYKVALYHGAVNRSEYAWQIMIPNMVRFLKKIAPVLEKRISNSPFARLTDDIRMSFYNEKVLFHFENGFITSIEELEFSSNWWENIRIPIRSAVPLFLGYRDRRDSEIFWKDMGANPKYAYLLDVMFPKMESFIYQIY